MKKFIKNWWFSITMFSLAIALFIYVIVLSFTFDDIEFYIIKLLFISALTPFILLFILGIANMPRKEKNDENK